MIFYCPRIAGNTGSAIRLCACTGARLHLIEPLVFNLHDDNKLKRAGLDYHDLSDVKVHANIDEAFATITGNVWAFTGHSSIGYTQVSYQDEDGLLFGPEDTGLPEEIMNHPRVTQRVRIPMLEGRRSLNLAMSAGIGLYHAWHELGFPQGK